MTHKLINGFAALGMLAALPGCALITSVQTGKPLDPAQVRSDLQVACTFDQLVPGGIATVGAIATISDPTFVDTAAQMTAADRVAHAEAQAACAAIPGQPAPLVVAVPGTAAPVPGTPIMLPATPVS